MPKVHPSHLETRRRGILAAAQRCIARNGIQATTMRDICRAANLSPGGVYRYFAGKQEILEALAEHRQQQVRSFFSRLAAVPPGQPREFTLAVLRLASALQQEAAQDGLRLDLQLWSEIQGSEPIRGALATNLQRILEDLTAGAPSDRTRRTEALVRAAVALLQGLALQQVLDPALKLDELIDDLRSQLVSG